MKTTTKPNIWKATLVRHSAWTVARNPQFEFAVETAHLHTASDIGRVQRAGGILAEPGEIEDIAHEENYPPEVQGLIPHVKGRFSTLKIEGAEIYIPAANTMPTLEEGHSWASMFTK